MCSFCNPLPFSVLLPPLYFFRLEAEALPDLQGGREPMSPTACPGDRVTLGSPAGNCIQKGRMEQPKAFGTSEEAGLESDCNSEVCRGLPPG